MILDALLNGIPITLANSYAPNKDDPDFFLQVFDEIDQLNASSLIVAGDFNTVITPLDYQGNINHHSNIRSSEMVSVLINKYGLCDIFGETFILFETLC